MGYWSRVECWSWTIVNPVMLCYVTLAWGSHEYEVLATLFFSHIIWGQVASRLPRHLMIPPMVCGGCTHHSWDSWGAAAGEWTNLAISLRNSSPIQSLSTLYVASTLIFSSWRIRLETQRMRLIRHFAAEAEDDGQKDKNNRYHHQWLTIISIFIQHPNKGKPQEPDYLQMLSQTKANRQKKFTFR